MSNYTEEYLNLKNKLKEEYNTVYKNPNFRISESKREIVQMGFLHNFLQDLETLEQIPLTLDNQRYHFLIFRNMLEQVIIFKYLNKQYEEDRNIYQDYLGSNINYDDIQIESDEECSANDINTETVKDIVKMQKKLGGLRTESYKNNFKELSEKFEPTDQSDDCTLYNLYSYLSDYCHNSYYHSIQDILGNCLDDDKFDKTSELIDLENEIATYKIFVMLNVCDEFF